ncbi:MAG: hypothetical protein FWF35_02055 [Elusimicrobia bacterium]|nr:hypothetical protein [Elusimicrobiota bacterium]
MKRILKLFMFAALFFCAALVYAQSNDYYACRCRQWNGSNLSSLGVALNTCCSLKQSGYNVGTNFTGGGTVVGTQSGANVTCGCTPNSKQPCGTCGMQTCSSSGSWGSCVETPRPNTRQDCSDCGVQTTTATCNPSAATWTLGSWSSCTGYYIMRTICCGTTTDTQCKAMGSANYPPACTNCSGNQYIKIDPAA